MASTPSDKVLQLINKFSTPSPAIYIYPKHPKKFLIDLFFFFFFNFTDAIVGISVAILIVLFSVQRLGTDKVGSTFAPVIFLWFSFISGIGLYNLFKHDIAVLRAFNPKYIVDYFRRNGKQGWISLGGIVLCITGEPLHRLLASLISFIFFQFNHHALSLQLASK